MKYLMHGFLTAVFSEPTDKTFEILARCWVDAEMLIARYQAQKGISRLTAVQRRTWRMLAASLLAFLDYLKFSAHKLTKEEHAALREDWLWRLLPGCIAGETVNRPALAKRPVVLEQDYLEVFLALIGRIRSAGGGIHILRVPKNERLFELTDPGNPSIEIYGYYADIYLRSAGRSFYCLGQQGRGSQASAADAAEPDAFFHAEGCICAAGCKQGTALCLKDKMGAG